MLWQPLNAPSSIFSTLDGIFTFVKLPQNLKAKNKISVTPAGISIVYKLLHSKKAESPIVFTSLCNVIDSNLSQRLNV